MSDHDHGVLGVRELSASELCANGDESIDDCDHEKILVTWPVHVLVVGETILYALKHFGDLLTKNGLSHETDGGYWQSAACDFSIDPN